MAGINELWAVAPGKASPEGLTSSAPVTEYAWPFTSFWNVTASESAALVICKRPENQPGCRAGQPAPPPPLGVPQAGTGAHDCRGQALERRAWAEEDTWPCGWRRAELPRSEPPLTTRAKAKCNPLRGRALHARAQDDSLISAGPGGRDSARHAECSGRTPDSIPEALSPPHLCSMSGPAQPHGLHYDYLLPRSVQNLLLFY